MLFKTKNDFLSLTFFNEENIFEFFNGAACNEIPLREFSIMILEDA